MEISVVTPVYGCPQALAELYSRLTKALSGITEDYEIILVNDNCPKNSWAEIEKICKDDEKVVGINLSRNYGQQKAIIAGLDVSKGNFVVVMDCDLQDRPEDIGKLYDKAKEGFDIVYAKGEAYKKRFTSKLFYKLFSASSGVKSDAGISNFTISSRRVVDAICSFREEYRAFTYYLQTVGFSQTTVTVSRDERYAGKSGYTFKKRLKLAMDIFYSFTDLPVRFLLFLGIICSALSFVAEIVFCAVFIPTNTTALLHCSLFCCMFFVLGIILIAIGMVGLYIVRTFNQVKNRPLYFIKDAINLKDDKQNKILNNKGEI